MITTLLPIGAAADDMVALARAFLAHTSATDDRPIWHVRELPLGGRELALELEEKGYGWLGINDAVAR